MLWALSRSKTFSTSHFYISTPTPQAMQRGFFPSISHSTSPSHQLPAPLSTVQILISDNKTKTHCGSCLYTLLLWRASWVIGNTGPECFGDVRHQNVSSVKETKYLQQHFLGSVSKTGPLLFSITVFIHCKQNQPSVLNIWGHNTETTIVHNVAQSCNQLCFKMFCIF